MTVEPFFDSMGVPRQDLTVEVARSRYVEQRIRGGVPYHHGSVGAGGREQPTPASGANFSNASVDPLLSPDPLPLLPPEELPNWQVHFETVPLQEVVLPLVEDEEPPPNGLPSLVSATNLEVDEDGFANAANDTVTARIDETDSTESLTATGTAVVNFGNDVPANLLGSIVLVDTPALDGQLHTHDGQSVTFALDVSGDLVGTVSAGATEVIRIHLVSAAAGPGAGA